MIAGHPEFRRKRFPFPYMAVVEKGAGLDGHLVIGVDRAGDGDLVEEVEKVQVLIEHDGGAEDSVGLGLVEFLQGVG